MTGCTRGRLLWPEWRNKQHRSINQPIHALRKQDTLCSCWLNVNWAYYAAASCLCMLLSLLPPPPFPLSPCVFWAATDLQHLSRWAGATFPPWSWHKVGWSRSADRADVPVWMIEGGILRCSLHLLQHQMTNNWLCTQRWGLLQTGEEHTARWDKVNQDTKQGKEEEEEEVDRLIAAKHTSMWAAQLFFGGGCHLRWDD